MQKYDSNFKKEMMHINRYSDSNHLETLSF